MKSPNKTSKSPSSENYTDLEEEYNQHVQGKTGVGNERNHTEHVTIQHGLKNGSPNVTSPSGPNIGSLEHSVLDPRSVRNPSVLSKGDMFIRNPFKQIELDILQAKSKLN